MESFLPSTMKCSSVAVILTCLFELCVLLRQLEPSFDSPMANISVKESTTAILPCSVSFLGKHEVIWTDQWSTLLTYQDRRIIDDDRLSVERPFPKDWNLHIRNVKYKDQGLYNCQINTNPVKIKMVNLRVQVPAKILNNESSSSIAAREGDTVTVICNVTGIPPPTVSWYRLNEDEHTPMGELASLTTRKKKVGMSGEVLMIHNISRECGDIYECVAYNGVPPRVSKQIRVNVQFPPEVRVANKRIGQYEGKGTVLDCSITANPQAVFRWVRRGEEVKTNGSQYRVEVYKDKGYTITLSLRIYTINRTAGDYGEYTCEASNDLGKASDHTILFDYQEYKWKFTTTTPEPDSQRGTPRYIKGARQYPNYQQQKGSNQHFGNDGYAQIQQTGGGGQSVGDEIHDVTKRPRYGLAPSDNERESVRGVKSDMENTSGRPVLCIPMTLLIVIFMTFTFMTSDVSIPSTRRKYSL